MIVVPWLALYVKVMDKNRSCYSIEDNSECRMSVTRNNNLTANDISAIRPKPQIGLFGAVAFGVGSIIGSGIFISPTGALRGAGSIGMSLLIWILCGLMSLILGLVYGELGCLIPKSGGDFTYIRKGLGAVPAFISVWTMTLFISAADMTVQSLVFADYFLAIVYGKCAPSYNLKKVTAAFMLFTICITNVTSVKIGTYIQIISTIIKVIPLAVVSIGGLVFLAQGRTENLLDSFEGTEQYVLSYSLAIYNCMFAYIGFDGIGKIAEEIINPQKNIPRAIILSILTVTVIYVITNLSYFILLPKAEFLQSSAVAYDWALKGIGPAAILIPICVMCSVYGACNGNSFITGRVMFAAARAGHFPEVMSYLHMHSRVPVVSLIIIHTISLIMLAFGDIGTLINFLSFMGALVGLFSTLSLLRLRRQLRNNTTDLTDVHTTFRTPLTIPILAAVIYLFFIISPFVTIASKLRIEFVYSACIIVVAGVLYIPFYHFHLALPGTDSVTTFLQLLCKVCPTAKID